MKKLNNLWQLNSKWLTLYCDLWQDNGKLLEYWRINKPNSIIIITTYKNC